MEVITDFYKHVLDTSSVLLSLNLIVLVICIYSLCVKKTAFSAGFTAAVVLFSLIFAIIGIRYYKDAFQGAHREPKEISIFDQEIKKAENIRQESRVRVAVEMVIALLALVILLRAKPDSKKQGIAISMIICASLMFIFDLYVSMRISDHIADLKIYKHNIIHEKNPYLQPHHH